MKRGNTIFSSPLAGKVIKILAQEGDFVEQGQGVFIVESMKMLHTLKAVKQGYLRQISVREGEVVTPQHHLACVG